MYLLPVLPDLGGLKAGADVKQVKQVNPGDTCPVSSHHAVMAKPAGNVMGKRLLFCYGTLQSPLVMKAVTGETYSGEEATLNDWGRYRFEKTEYPGIVVEPGSSVQGKLYWGLDDNIFEKLDEFEGDKYERVKVTVTMGDGSAREAFVYAVKNNCTKLLSDERWDFDRFLQNGLERFINWFVEDRRDLFDRGDL